MAPKYYDNDNSLLCYHAQLSNMSKRISPQRHAVRISRAMQLQWAELPPTAFCTSTGFVLEAAERQPCFLWLLVHVTLDLVIQVKHM